MKEICRYIRPVTYKEKHRIPHYENDIILECYYENHDISEISVKKIFYIEPALLSLFLLVFYLNENDK